MVMERLGMPAGPVAPVGDRAFVQVEGGDDGLGRAAVRAG